MIFNLGNEFDNLAFLLVLINFLTVPRLLGYETRLINISQ